MRSTSIFIQSVCFLLFASSVNAQSDLRITSDIIEKEIQGTSSHSYQVNLESGDFAKISVLQKGIDLVLTVINPSGKKELEIDTPNGTQGFEVASFVAAEQGLYKITVHPLEVKAPAGNYEIKLVSKLNAEEYKKSQPISILASPTIIYIEKGEGQQFLNFEFLMANSGNDTVTIRSIELSVKDKNNQLIVRKFLNGNGSAPGILTIPERVLNGPSQLTLFNPFYTFEDDMDLSTLEFLFVLQSQIEEEFKVLVKVNPTIYQTKTKLVLPLKGKVLIEDGHDFYAHHRRFNYAHPFLKNLGFRSNFMRYSYDFVTLNTNGESYVGNSHQNESWDCFGKPVYAPAAGKVVAVINTMPDNRRFDESKLQENQMILFGNYIVVDHLNGEFSLFAHLQEGSTKVKLGDTVNSGQQIAAIGASGSANIPHLHYELRTSADHLAEGLPSYFSNFKMWGKKIAKGQLDSGDIVEN